MELKGDGPRGTVVSAAHVEQRNDSANPARSDPSWFGESCAVGSKELAGPVYFRRRAATAQQFALIVAGGKLNNGDIVSERSRRRGEANMSQSERREPDGSMVEWG